MKRIEFCGMPIKANLSIEFKPGEPHVYFLTNSGSKEPFYIGEYGQAKTYDIVGRIARHFARSGTLRRVAKNLDAFRRQVPSSFSAFIKALPEEFKDADKRKDLEAWIIWLVCNEMKMQSDSFCVVKYQAPVSNQEVMARQIIQEFLAHP